MLLLSHQSISRCKCRSKCQKRMHTTISLIGIKTRYVMHMCVNTWWSLLRQQRVTKGKRSSSAMGVGPSLGDFLHGVDDEGLTKLVAEVRSLCFPRSVRALLSCAVAIR